MGGAVVPGDWDGSSYQCVRVIWPDSVDYQALLVGQITEPQSESFWDAETGDVSEAIAGMVTSELQTIETGWIEDCLTVETPPTFVVHTTQGNTLLAGIWEPITFNIETTEIGDPGWQGGLLPTPAHRPYLEDKAGLWLYTLNLASHSPSQMFIAIRDGAGGAFIGLTGDDGGYHNLTLVYDFAGQDKTLVPFAYAAQQATLDLNSYNCYFSGVYLGDTV